jgi:signal transduction histidine kinase
MKTRQIWMRLALLKLHLPSDDAVTSGNASAVQVGELQMVAHAVSLENSARSVFQTFARFPELPGALVQDQNKHLHGLISRRRFMEIFSQPYRAEVYFSRSLEVLLRDEFAQPLCVGATQSIDSAAQQALARDRHNFYEPIAVDLGGYEYRILELQELLHALARQYKFQFQQLQSVKDSLVQAEKMASLGELVAGVAHEINTPIGVSLSAASYLSEQIEQFDRTVAQQQVRKTDLTAMVQNTREASGIILRNMERAAELVRSFKQVAADQTSESRRTFDLAETVQDILFSLGPSLKHSGVRLQHRVETGIEMDCFPGALAQIISNLVLNSLVHAYDDGDEGTISVEADRSATGDEVIVSVSDDGKGIAPHNLSRIFDPFFTTRRNQGGTGLGLHIVHNLVHGSLCGTIRVTSTLGAGARFEVRIPRVTPVQTARASQ